MNIICGFVLVVLSASVTGSIFALIWIVLIKFFGKYLRTDFIYFSLKCVIVSFYIPSSVLILIMKTYFVWGGSHYYLFFTNIMRIVLCFVFIVFASMLAREIYKWILGNIRIKKSIIMMAEINDETKAMVKEIKKKLKIKRNFKVYKALGIGSPFIFGFFRPDIYLTVDNLSKDDMEITLTHEMLHYKQRDNVFKPLSGIMCCINWFNPLAWYIKEEYKIWAEGGCDYKCMKIGGYDSEDYFDCLVRTANSMVDSFSGFISMSSDEHQVYERAVIAGGHSFLKIKTKVVSAIILCSLLFSGITVYAATDFTEMLFNILFTKSSEQFEEIAQLCDDGYIEYIIQDKSNIENYDYIDSYEEIRVDNNNEIKTENNDICRTIFVDIIDRDKETIVLSLEGVPDNATLGTNAILEQLDDEVEFGLIEPDGVKRYIKAVGQINHFFYLKQSGNYKIFISNKNDKPIKASISVIYWQDEK